MDFVPQQPSVFINLYNNHWNTNFRFWQEGSWSERVKFWPLSKGANSAENLAINSWEARLPLLVATAKGPAGTLPVSQTGLSLSRPGVLVTAFGDDPDGNPGTLLRVWEQSRHVRRPCRYSARWPEGDAGDARESSRRKNRYIHSNQRRQAQFRPPRLRPGKLYPDSVGWDQLA